MDDVDDIEEGRRHDSRKTARNQTVPGDGMAHLPKNPFHNATEAGPLPWYEVVKMIIMFPVALARLIVILVIILLTCTWVAIVSIGHSPTDEHGNPQALGTCRRILLQPLHWGCRLVMFFCGFYWIEEYYWDGSCWKYGYLDSSACPPIITPNHISLVEAFYFLYKYLPSIVCKADVVEYPVIGRAAAALHPILVPRTQEHARRLPNVADQLRRRAERPPGVSPVLIFPEGTTVNQEYLVQFQRGAFLAGAPVQPVAIRYPYCTFDCSWTPDVSAAWVLYRLLSQVYNRMQVTYLSPFHPTPEQQRDHAAYGSAVREAIAAVLDCDTVDFSDHDVLLYNACMAAGAGGAYAIKTFLSQPGPAGRLPRGMYTREGERVLHRSVHDLIRLAKRFREVDRDASGTLTLDELETALGLTDPSPPTRRMVERIFELMDRDGDGVIAWRELLLGLGMLAESTPPGLHDDAAAVDEGSELRLRLAFVIFDQDGNGRLSREEVVQSLLAMDRARQRQLVALEGESRAVREGSSHALQGMKPATMEAAEQRARRRVEERRAHEEEWERKRRAETGPRRRRQDGNPPPIPLRLTSDEANSPDMDDLRAQVEHEVGDIFAEAGLEDSSDGMDVDTFRRIVSNESHFRRLVLSTVRAFHTHFGLDEPRTPAASRSQAATAAPVASSQDSTGRNGEAQKEDEHHEGEERDEEGGAALYEDEDELAVA